MAAKKKSLFGAQDLTGIIAPMTTPFTRKGDVDEGAFRKQVNFLIETGVHGLAVGGSTGEGHTLSTKEATRLVRIAMTEAKGRVPVVAGIIVDSTQQAIERAEAVADLNLVYATTARPRGMSADVVAPREAAAGLRRAIEAGQAAGVLFGPERSGLTNDDIALADAIMTVPLNPGFSSIQLGHAVMILGYEWYQAGEGGRQASVEPKHPPAAKVDLIGFFEHLERELDACGFLHPPEMRPTITRNLRTLFQRARLTDREVRTLRGVVAGLSSARNRDGED